MNISTAAFISAGHNTPTLPWHLRMHSHPNPEVIVVEDGVQTVLIQGRKHVANAGSILFYPKGIPHEEWAESGQPFASHFFDFTWPDAPKDIPVLLEDRQGRVRILVNWLYEERSTPSLITPMITGTLLQAILAEILRLWLHPADALVDQIRTYASRHIQADITLDQLAKVSGMSKFHFVRKYKALTGVTPMADLRILRIQRARDLIMTTDRAIKTIAEGVGFTNVFHFSRLFKQCMGMPPGSLRRHPNPKSHPSRGRNDELQDYFRARR